MVKLSGFPLMLQAAVLDGVAFDPFMFHQDGLPAPEAKREQRGMWGGSFKEPWNYRFAGGQVEGRKVVRTIEARRQALRQRDPLHC